MASKHVPLPNSLREHGVATFSWPKTADWVLLIQASIIGLDNPSFRLVRRKRSRLFGRLQCFYPSSTPPIGALPMPESPTKWLALHTQSVLKRTFSCVAAI